MWIIKDKNYKASSSSVSNSGAGSTSNFFFYDLPRLEVDDFIDSNSLAANNFVFLARFLVSPAFSSIGKIRFRFNFLVQVLVGFGATRSIFSGSEYNGQINSYKYHCLLVVRPVGRSSSITEGAGISNDLFVSELFWILQSLRICGIWYFVWHWNENDGTLLYRVVFWKSYRGMHSNPSI